MVLPFPDLDLNDAQSMTDKLWRLKPPLTLVSAGKSGVEKFPEKSMAPPTVLNAGKLILPRLVLLAT